MRLSPPWLRSASFRPWSQATLIWQFARREVLGRYRGSWLGLAWSLLTPLLMLVAFTLVFMGVFKARWPGAENQGGLEFGLQIFAGLLVFNLFAEMANRAPRLVLEQPNLVKRVVFPLEVLPWVALLAALFHMLLSLAILVLATWWARGGLPITAVALPLVLAPFVPFLLGLGWLFSALGVYVRDVAQLLGLAVSLAMFLSPIFYSSRSLSEPFQSLMQLNPLTLIIENLRLVLLAGQWPDWPGLALYLLLAMVFAVLGAAFFEATRRGFSDVL